MRIKKSGGNLPWCSKEELDKLFLFEAEFSLMFVKANAGADEAFSLYLIIDVLLIALYCAIWIICWKKNSVFRALALSIIPSVIFLFSGFMSRSILLIITSILFAPSHILISYKNAKCVR
jgi:hypothetical protein